MMVLDEEHYHTSGDPKKCMYCGGESFDEKIIDTIEHHVSEKSIFCTNCKSEVAYWAYGNFDSSYGYKDVEEQE